jgi:CspA family cold shock protein
MATGTVKWFSDAKGYGFISPDEGEQDLFVHYSGIADGGFRTLAEGARVQFELREGRRGLEAFNVTPVGAPARAAPRRPARRPLQARPKLARSGSVRVARGGRPR